LNLAEYPFLADENIHPDVIAHLRDSGFDLLSVVEAGLIGSSDEKVLQFAFEAGRIVLTHDSDFGTLALAYQQPIIGILYIRPGHIQPSFTIDSLAAILDRTYEITPPFIIVGTRQGQRVHIRARQL
jgi:predicted nuclease of predicted toxin-antitoxin system